MRLSIVLFSLIITNLSLASPLYVYGEKEKILTKPAFELDSTQGLESLPLRAPNTQAVKGSNRTKFYQLRGMGEYENFTPFLRRSVSVVLDDIDYSDLPHAFYSFAIAKQVIIYGPSMEGATAGTLTLTSNNLSKDPELETLFSYGSNDTHNENIRYSTGTNTIIPTQIILSKYDSNGPYQNIYLKRDDTHGNNEFFIRTKSLYEINKDNKLQYQFHFTSQKNGYDAFVQNNTFETESDRPGRDDLNFFNHKLDYINEISTFKNKTSIQYQRYNSFYSYDEDWGNNEKWLNTAGYNALYDYRIEYPKERERKSLAHELSIDQSSLSLFYQNTNDQHRERGFKNEFIRKNIFTTIDEDKLLLKGQHTWWKNNIQITTKMAIEKNTIKYQDSDFFSRSLEDYLVRTKLSLEYNQFGLHFARGSKAGGINTQSLVPESRKIYKPENTYHFDFSYHDEIGSKQNLLKINLFLLKRDQPQTKTSFQANQNDPSTFTFYTDNADSAYHYGSEIVFLSKLTSKWKLKTGLGLLKTRYGDYLFGGRNLAKRSVPNAPEYQFNLLTSYQLTDTLKVGARYYQQDNYYFSNSHDLKAKGHQLLSIFTKWEKKKYFISGEINNITKENYATRGFYFGNNPPNFEDELYTQKGLPRTFFLNFGFTI